LFRKYLITLIKIVVSTALIIFLFVKLGFNDILIQLTSANLWWLFFAIFIFSLSNFLGSFQWYLLLKIKGIHLPFLRVVSYYYVGLFFNNFLIGYIGGDAIRIYDISKVSGDSSKAISTVFLDRFIGFVVLTGLALFAGLIWHDIFQVKNVIFIIIFIFICWMLSFVFLFNEKLAKKIGIIIKYLLPLKIYDKLREVYININSFKHAKKTIVQIIFISIAIQSIRILVHYFAALSVGLHGHLKYFFIFIPVVALMASLPISIGGIGVREGSGVALFSTVPTFLPEMIVAMEFLAYLIGLISALPGGILFVLRKEKVKLE